MLKTLTCSVLLLWASTSFAFAQSPVLEAWIGTWTVTMDDGSRVQWAITDTWASDTGKSHMAYGIKNPGKVSFQIYYGTMFKKHNYIEADRAKTVYDLPMDMAEYTELVPSEDFMSFTARGGKYSVRSGFRGTVEPKTEPGVPSPPPGFDSKAPLPPEKPGDKHMAPGKTGTVTDIEGNIYKTITIGKQEWMAENLKTARYSDGTPLACPGTDMQAWENNSSGAYAWHNNNSDNRNIYGALYNWPAVTSPHGLCPSGWHVPSDAEWQQLVDYLGGESVAGGAMKSTRTEPEPHPRYKSPNAGATDSSGFSGLPGGLRRSNGTFRDSGFYGAWWSTTDGGKDDAWHRSIFYTDTTVYHFVYGKGSGMSVRCVKGDHTPERNMRPAVEGDALK